MNLRVPVTATSGLMKVKAKLLHLCSGWRRGDMRTTDSHFGERLVKALQTRSITRPTWATKSSCMTASRGNTLHSTNLRSHLLRTLQATRRTARCTMFSCILMGRRRLDLTLEMKSLTTAETFKTNPVQTNLFGWTGFALRRVTQNGDILEQSKSTAAKPRTVSVVGGSGT